jgi:hypothetical protein
MRLLATIATIGALYDVTLEELRLETLLPADPSTEIARRKGLSDAPLFGSLGRSSS